MRFREFLSESFKTQATVDRFKSLLSRKLSDLEFKHDRNTWVNSDGVVIGLDADLDENDGFVKISIGDLDKHGHPKYTKTIEVGLEKLGSIIPKIIAIAKSK